MLQGSTEVLRTIRPLLLIESFHPKTLKCLEQFNYILFEIGEGCNYLAYPREQQDFIETECLPRHGLYKIPTANAAD